jgi:hypothetical protein
MREQPLRREKLSRRLYATELKTMQRQKITNPEQDKEE